MRETNGAFAYALDEFIGVEVSEIVAFDVVDGGFEDMCEEVRDEGVVGGDGEEAAVVFTGDPRTEVRLLIGGPGGETGVGGGPRGLVHYVMIVWFFTLSHTSATLNCPSSERMTASSTKPSTTTGP